MAVLAVLAVLAAAEAAAEISIPIVVSVFLFFLLEPVIQKIEEKALRRTIAAPVLVSLISIALTCGSFFFFKSSARLAQQIPQYSGKIRETVRKFAGHAANIQMSTQKLISPGKQIAPDIQKVEIVSDPLQSWTSFLARGVNSIFAILAQLVMIPILTTFLLLEKTFLRDKLAALLRRPALCDGLSRDLEKMVKAYFMGNLLVGLGASIGFYLLFIGLRLENPLSLALSSGYLNLIPIFGTILGAVLPIMQSLFQFESFTPPLLIIIGSLVLHFAVNNIIMPKVVGSSVNINASSATLGLFVFGWIWGGMGLILAIPLLASLRIVLAAFPETEGWADLLSQKTS